VGDGEGGSDGLKLHHCSTNMLEIRIVTVALIGRSNRWCRRRVAPAVDAPGVCWSVVIPPLLAVVGEVGLSLGGRIRST